MTFVSYSDDQRLLKSFASKASVLLGSFVLIIENSTLPKPYKFALSGESRQNCRPGTLKTRKKICPAKQWEKILPKCGEPS